MTTDMPIFNETSFAVDGELDSDLLAREALLDLAMGEGRRRKSSEKLRCGRLPSNCLALVARKGSGAIIGTVRLWDVSCGAKSLLLLGPLAVDPSVSGQGIGSALMRHAISRATDLGHGAIILVGDAPYYSRFGFSAAKTGGVMMPGPVERDRLLGCELKDRFLDGSSGLLIARGRRADAFQSCNATRKSAAPARFGQVA